MSTIPSSVHYGTSASSIDCTRLQGRVQGAVPRKGQHTDAVRAEADAIPMRA